jgi:hypothetical protein
MTRDTLFHQDEELLLIRVDMVEIYGRLADIMTTVLTAAHLRVER